MPLAYLDANPADAQGFNRLGASFTDALLGMQQQRIAQQRFAQQMLLEQQRLQLQRQAQEDAMKTSALERNKLTADTAKSQFALKQAQEDQQTGGELGDVLKGIYETDPTKNPETMQFLRALQAQRVARIAATNPSNIVKQISALSQARDPGVERLIATDTPALQNVPAGASVIDTMTGRPVFNAPPRVSLMDPQRIQMEDLRSLSNLYGHVGQRIDGDPSMSNAVNQRLLQILQGRGASSGGDLTPPPAQSSRVRMRDKNGNIGTVPVEQVEAAKSAGYTLDE